MLSETPKPQAKDLSIHAIIAHSKNPSALPSSSHFPAHFYLPPI